MSPLAAAALAFLGATQDAAVDQQDAADLSGTTTTEPETPQGGGIVEEKELPPGTYLGSLRTLYDDGKIDLSWGGRIEYDAGVFSLRDDYPVDGEDGTEFRRLRFYSEGYLYDVYAKLEFDFSSGNIGTRDAFLSWDQRFGRLQVGRFKQPTSLENQTSGHLLTFMERGLPVTALTQLRNTGIMLSDVTSNLHWQLGLFVRSDGNGFGVTSDGTIKSARVVFPFRPRIDRVFHLGAWVNHSPDDDGSVRYDTRPEAHLLANVADTGNIPADGALTYGLELAWSYGRYSVQGEYMGAKVDAAGMSDPTYHGWYVYTSYFLTGENRNYKPEYGAFGRVRPDVDHKRGLSGAWEVALRYSTIDLDDGPSGDVLDDVTVGLNWYWNPHTRISLNYVYSDFKDHLSGSDGTMNALMLRFHADW